MAGLLNYLLLLMMVIEVSTQELDDCDCMCFSYDCKSSGNQDNTQCSSNNDHALGMESGAIADGKISASSEYSEDDGMLPSKDARLNNDNGWATETGYPTAPWIQVDLLHSTIVTGIITQGSAYTSDHEWVTDLQIQFGVSEDNLMFILENDMPKTFPANKNRERAVTITFPQPIRTRFLRIRPTSWNEWCTLRFEILGCLIVPFEGDSFHEPVCTNPDISLCEEGASDCNNQWKCCTDSTSTVSCKQDLDTDTGTCGGDNECLGDPVGENCCYNVLCNCTTPKEATTSSHAYEQTTGAFVQTTGTVPKIQSSTKITSSTPRLTPEQTSDVPGNTSDISTTATGGTASALPNNPSDSLTTTSYTLSSEESHSQSSAAVILASSEKRSQGSGAGIGIGITIPLLLLIVIAFIIYFRKKGFFKKKDEKVIQDQNADKISSPSEPGAEIGDNTYAGAKTMNLNLGYEPGDKDSHAAAGNSKNQSEGDMGAGIYMDPEQLGNHNPGQPAGITGTTNPAYDAIHKPVITDSSEEVYSEPTAPTSNPIASGYQSIRKESNVYAEPTDPAAPAYEDTFITPSTPPTGNQSLTKPNDNIDDGVYQDPDRYMAGNTVQGANNNAKLGYEDVVLQSAPPLSSGYQSIKVPNEDMGSEEYQDPDTLKDIFAGQTTSQSVTNPNYGDISSIGLTGSANEKSSSLSGYQPLKKSSQPDDDMGSEEYQDPGIYRDENTGQNLINGVENPDYDAINNITIPPAPTNTNTDLKKQLRQDYTDLKLDNARMPAHYQSLKKPNEDMGGDTYADPDQYTDGPKCTTDIGEATYADPDKFTAVPTLKNDENQDGKDEEEGTTDFADPEYFTLEPPPQDDREYSLPPDAQGSQQ